MGLEQVGPAALPVEGQLLFPLLAALATLLLLSLVMAAATAKVAAMPEQVVLLVKVAEQEVDY